MSTPPPPGPPAHRDAGRPAPAQCSSSPAPTRWSGTDTGPLPVPVLRPLQRAALSTLRAGHRIAKGGLRGVDAADAQQVVAFPTPTVHALLRYGFIEEEDTSGVYRATDHGLRALAVLPAS
ncbi:MAG: hypothetical protein JSR41_18730 [Proteobacteria bacterium]|nr:hypothetical protein [Pseudomonadota bacterium]